MGPLLTNTKQVLGAEPATQKYCEHPGRCARGLAHCGTLLDSHHVLHRINEFGEAPDMLRGVGLPWSCRTIEAASSGVVTEKRTSFHLFTVNRRKRKIKKIKNKEKEKNTQKNRKKEKKGKEEKNRRKKRERIWENSHKRIITYHNL